MYGFGDDRYEAIGSGRFAHCLFVTSSLLVSTHIPSGYDAVYHSLPTSLVLLWCAWPLANVSIRYQNNLSIPTIATQKGNICVLFRLQHRPQQRRYARQIISSMMLQSVHASSQIHRDCKLAGKREMHAQLDDEESRPDRTYLHTWSHGHMVTVAK